MFGKKPEPKQEPVIKRGGFGVNKKPPAPPAPVFKDLRAKCICCPGRVRNKKNSKGTFYAQCNLCKQVYRYMPKTMKPKIWYESFGPKPK